jgi:hypothetical protein
MQMYFLGILTLEMEQPEPQEQLEQLALQALLVPQELLVLLVQLALLEQQAQRGYIPLVQLEVQVPQALQAQLVPQELLVLLA